MRRRRYLAGAYLSPVADRDLLPWVQGRAQEGRLAQAVRDGLRLVQHLCGLPGGDELQRRGILVEAVKAGLLPMSGGSGQVRTPVLPPQGMSVQQDVRSGIRDVERDLDRELGIVGT